MAATKVITAHIVVEFSGDEGFTAFVEVDDREFGFNGGRTRFLPGQDAYLLLFKPTGYSVVHNASTAGSLVKTQNSVKDIDEIVSFANEDAASVRYPIDANFSTQWIGAAAGTISKNGQFGVSLPARPIDPNTQLPIPEYRIGIARLLYQANCEVWKLTSVPDSVEQVLCFFVVKKDAP